MNFLAHLKLSGKHNNIMLGNFIADHIKGNKINYLPSDVIEGIILHRKIDFYTDTHSEVIKSKKRLYNKYHKYSGIIIDIYYDHFLAKNWNKYSNISLNLFTYYSYTILLKNYTLLPKKTKEILPKLIINNWLSSYKNFSGLIKTFDLINKRTKFKIDFNNIIDDLILDYDKYEQEFNTFFPEISNYIEIELNKLYPKTPKKNIIYQNKKISK